ncbi:Pre-mRNA-splicing factor of RES complex [Popillia japonica]|uniref:BUD13 homolog n=1 Tax=Popillia japonica TaxID=7064 RepID=A0AAW1IX59_POPJA
MSGINQKEYLKKYLSLGSEPGKKKKRKKKSTGTSDRIKIIDDDIDSVIFNQAVEDDLNAQNEDAPQIVGVIDDRPLELRISDYRDSDLWKPVSGELNNENRDAAVAKTAQDEGRSSSYSPPMQKNKHMNSPIKRDPDASPIRRNKSNEDSSPKRKNRRYNDGSPVRRTRSPFRGGKRDSDVSPARRGSDISPSRKGRRNSDISPARKSPAIKRGRRDSDPSPPRRSRRDSDISPRRHLNQNKRSEDISPPRRQARDSDVSPSRRRSRREARDRNDYISPARRNQSKAKYNISPRRSADKRGGSTNRRNRRGSDPSPPRRYRSNSSSRKEISPKRGSRDLSPKSPDRTYNHRNMSPPRRDRKDKSSPNRSSTSRHISPNRGGAKITPRERGDSDSDRGRSFEKEKKDYNKSKIDRKDVEEISPKPEKPRSSRWDQEPAPKPLSPPPLPKPRDIRKSGLQRANDIIMGKDPTFQPSTEFSDIAGFSGAIAPIVRDRKTGKIRDFKKEAEEAEQKKEKEDELKAKYAKWGRIRDFKKEAEEAEQKKEKEDELKAKYAKWGRGLKQVEDATDKLNSELHEMSKPLARYADDEDLERHLKEMERDGDPMLQYLRKKRKKQDVESGKPVRPQFEGEFMPNRYGIRPGHRWDGVDRSNGYEKKWFEVMNSRRAQMEDAYKWSTEDM